uniref:PH01B031C15.5 protein n=1 Tax=Phyllostachys edulis TaxID=38705 RepID=L0P2L1_PHYED|nr:PH01B031C15.5 [Phyllostachys edulis]
MWDLGPYLRFLRELHTKLRKRRKTGMGRRRCKIRRPTSPTRKKFTSILDPLATTVGPLQTSPVPNESGVKSDPWGEEESKDRRGKERRHLVGLQADSGERRGVTLWISKCQRGREQGRWRSSGSEEAGEEKKDAAKATGKGEAWREESISVEVVKEFEIFSGLTFLALLVGAGGAALDGGPTGTPLPDKKLLLFILDRLQKKDTYGVFSEPVDPEELPDYHEIIEHPMDFSTIREKLLNDSYANLEQFENDVFLLTSNAMSYNSDDTIYYRQFFGNCYVNVHTVSQMARSIEALAKKDFENLRQASDGEEEPKTVPRRGRPPKNAKKTVEKADDDVSPDLSNVKTSKSADNAETRKRLTGDRARHTNISTRDASILHHNTLGSFSGKRTDKIGDYSGSSKYGKKTTSTSLDDDRRSTYDQQYSRNSPLFSALDCERKLLVPVGLQQQHAYSRSLARFAAKLGPIGWDMAAKGIRRVLPPGTNFGPGWVVDGEPPQNSQWPRVPQFTDPSAESSIPCCNMTSKSDELHRSSGLSSNGNAIGEEHLAKNQPMASTSAGFDKSSEFGSKVPKYENGVKMPCDGVGNTGPTPPLQQHSYSREIQSNINGFTAVPNTVSQYTAQGFFGSGMQMTHAQVLGMFSGVNGRTNGYIHGHPLAAECVKTTHTGDVGKETTNPSQDAGHDPKGVLPQNENRSAPSSLNAGIQSSGSPPRGKVANPKHPDLALQL